MLILHLIASILMSLPARERELKSKQFNKKNKRVKSLPARERELKFLSLLPFLQEQLSLPARERELK